MSLKIIIISCSWKIIECYANNAKDKEEEYQRMKEKQQYEPVIVEFRDQIINEIYVSDTSGDENHLCGAPAGAFVKVIRFL